MKNCVVILLGSGLLLVLLERCASLGTAFFLGVCINMWRLKMSKTKRWEKIYGRMRCVFMEYFWDRDLECGCTFEYVRIGGHRVYV